MTVTLRKQVSESKGVTHLISVITDTIFLKRCLKQPKVSNESKPVQCEVNMWSSENQGQKMREMREKQTVSNIPTTSSLI